MLVLMSYVEVDENVQDFHCYDYYDWIDHFLRM